MKYWLVASLIGCSLWAQEEHKTPQQIAQELQDAEAQFKHAKEMFNPWYTGPLVTPSAGMVPPGQGMLQPYIFVNDDYAVFNEDRDSVSIPNKVNFNPLVVLQVGVTDTLDVQLIPQADVNWQSGATGGGLGDTSIVLGFPICPETLNVPAMKFTLTEIFPTGRYQRLNTDGLALGASGSGAWQTQFGFTFSKLTFWSYQHPFKVRGFIGYKFALPVTVHGFNAYGGGFGTYGRVHPGNSFSADLGMELSLTQKWVLATDVVYSCQNSTGFSGTLGTTSTGSSASVGGGFNDQLSLAPALEYNWSPNLGIIGGVQFSVYGRNSSNFVSGQISVCWTFDIVK